MPVGVALDLAESGEVSMDIGEERPAIVIEPAEQPVPKPLEEPVPREPSTDPVPAEPDRVETPA
jgi:hypothetical protein